MAAEGDQILPPHVSSSAVGRDVSSLPPNTDHAEEQLQSEVVQDTSLGSGVVREDTEELKGVKDADEGEQKQKQEGEGIGEEEEEEEETEEQEQEQEQDKEDKEDNSESYREAKRRKTSPAALKKPEEPCSRAERAGGDEATAGPFSFSFDVRGLTSPIETTPRFGSMVPKYNSADLVAAVAEIGGGRADEETGKAVTKAVLGGDA